MVSSVIFDFDGVIVDSERLHWSAFNAVMGLEIDMSKLSSIMRQFQAHDEKYEQIEYEIVEEERPPMITLPEYREKFGRP